MGEKQIHALSRSAKGKKPKSLYYVKCLNISLIRRETTFPSRYLMLREISPEMAAKYYQFFEQSLTSAHFDFYFLMYQCDCMTSLCPLLNLSAYCPSRHIPVVCVPLSITGGLCSNSKNTLNFRNMSFNNMRSFTKTTEYGNLTHSYLCSCKYSLGLFKR